MSTSLPRNIAQVSVTPVSQLNALAVLQPKHMLVTRSALDALKQKSQAAGKQTEDADA